MATQIINGVIVQRVEEATTFGGDTIGSVLETNDVVPLTEFGMARTPQDAGEGVELGGGGAAPYVLPPAAAASIGGVKKTTAVTAVVAGADLAALITAHNDLVTKLRAAGIVT